MALEDAVVVTTTEQPDAAEPQVQETVAVTSETDEYGDPRPRDEYGRFITAEPDDDTPQDEEPPPVQQPRRGSPEHRINQAVKRQREAERRAEAAEQQLRSYQPQAQRQAPPQQAPQGEPTEEQFEKYEDYIASKAEYWALRAVSKYTDAQRAEAEQAAQQRAQYAVIQAHAQRVAVAKSRYADFEDVVDNDEVPVSPAMEDAILHSPVGPDIMHFFGTRPAEAVRIAQLPPGPALIAMGHVEAYVQSVVASASQAPRVPTSRTPPPVRPVSGGSHISTTPLDQLSPLEFIRVRNEAERNRVRY